MNNDEIELYKDNILLDNEASFAPFGYSFQADAGLYLFCYYYNDVEQIKIESALQDIEVMTKNGFYIMAQAKASQDPFNCSTHGNKLYDALFSLARHYVSNNDILLYVTNIPNIFGNEMSGQFNDTIVPYKRLSQQAKEIINTKITDISIDIEKLLKSKNTSEKQKEKLKAISEKIKKLNLDSLCFLSITRYYDDNQRRSIKEKIAELLNKTFEITDLNKIAAIIDELFFVWHEMFYLNSSKNGKKKDKKITKNDFCWPIITIGNMKRTPDEIVDYFDGDYSIELGYEINRRKNDFISSYNYELINEIINDYMNFKSNNIKDKKMDFIINNWEKYSNYFYDEDLLICKGTTMFFLYGILSDYYLAKKVLKGRSL